MFFDLPALCLNGSVAARFSLPDAARFGLPDTARFGLPDTWGALG